MSRHSYTGPSSGRGRALAISLAVILLLGASALGLSNRASGQAPAGTPAPAASGAGGPLGLGRPATSAEIQRWNIDVLPDGTGLPPGGGTSAQGQAIYSAKCASCHGDSGREGGAGPILVAAAPFQTGVTPKTVGNFWPYASIIWDYTNRSMPADAPGSLQPGEVYALVAFMLNANGIISSDAVMNAQTLPKVVMPNVNGFIPDRRPDVP